VFVHPTFSWPLLLLDQYFESSFVVYMHHTRLASSLPHAVLNLVWYMGRRRRIMRKKRAFYTSACLQNTNTHVPVW
jgi:hypothetical protein